MFFSVVTTETENYDAGDIINFHEVLADVNPGFPGWNPATNMFTCPYDGYYFFIVTLYKSTTTSYNADARLRSTSTSTIARLDNHRQDYQSNLAYSHYSSTMQAIVPCGQGEQVWVQMVSSASLSGGLHRNQFSGRLIKQGLGRD